MYKMHVFTFHYIRLNHYKSRTVSFLHYNMVELKLKEEEEEQNIINNLHSNMVELKL